MNELKPRYKLQVGRWGMYVHDTETGQDIDMEAVITLLNTPSKQYVPKELRDAVEFLRNKNTTEASKADAGEVVTEEGFIEQYVAKECQNYHAVKESCRGALATSAAKTAWDVIKSCGLRIVKGGGE